MVTEEEHRELEEARERLITDHGIPFSKSNAVRTFMLLGIEARKAARKKARK